MNPVSGPHLDLTTQHADIWPDLVVDWASAFLVVWVIPGVFASLFVAAGIDALSLMGLL